MPKRCLKYLQDKLGESDKAELDSIYKAFQQHGGVVLGAKNNPSPFVVKRRPGYHMLECYTTTVREYFTLQLDRQTLMYYLHDQRNHATPAGIVRFPAVECRRFTNVILQRYLPPDLIACILTFTTRPKSMLFTRTDHRRVRLIYELYQDNPASICKRRKKDNTELL